MTAATRTYSTVQPACVQTASYAANVPSGRLTTTPGSPGNISAGAVIGIWKSTDPRCWTFATVEIGIPWAAGVEVGAGVPGPAGDADRAGDPDGAGVAVEETGVGDARDGVGLGEAVAS